MRADAVHGSREAEHCCEQAVQNTVHHDAIAPSRIVRLMVRHQ